MKIIQFLGGASALPVSMLALATPVLAQTAGMGAPPSPAPEATVSSTEIIVTAQRRSERLRDVPMSVTAIGADALTKGNIMNTTELAKVTPGLTLPQSGAYVLPSLRGISSSGSSAGDAPNVAIYIDGVYQSSLASSLGDLPNIQSVQVLKGPQGSLYGQNAAGGAIIIDTIAPSFAWKGKATLSYGNYDNKIAQGYLSGPITDTLAIAVSGNYQNRQGFGHDILQGGHDRGLRSAGFSGKLLWQATPDIALTLKGYIFQHADTAAYAAQPLNGNTLARLYINLPCAYGGLACTTVPQPQGKRDFAANVPGDAVTKEHGLSLVGKIDVGDAGTINTVLAYNSISTDLQSDVDGSALNIGDFNLYERGRDYIGEINFVSSKFHGATLTAGAFIMDKKEGYYPYFYNARFDFASKPTLYPALPAPFPYQGGGGAYDGGVHKKSYAAYAELGYDITDKLTATLAGRYSWETQLAANGAIIGSYTYGSPLPVPITDPRGQFLFSKFTPRAVLRYKVDNDNTFYASYSQGFKSGFVNSANILCGLATHDNSCIDAPVKPEVVYAYEGGYKARLSSALNLNVSVFHYDYKNIQVFVYNPILGSQFQNAASGKITGVDADVTYRPTSEVTLSGGMSYLHARYSNFPAATVYIPNACPAITGLPAGSFCGNTQTSGNVSGHEMLRTPQWTANASADLTHRTAIGRAELYVAANYNSGIYFDPANRIHQTPYTLIDGELSLRPSGMEAVKLSVWAKNLTNATYLQSVLESQLEDSVSYADPRTFGVKFEYQFR